MGTEVGCVGAGLGTGSWLCGSRSWFRGGGRVFPLNRVGFCGDGSGLLPGGSGACRVMSCMGGSGVWGRGWAGGCCRGWSFRCSFSVGFSPANFSPRSSDIVAHMSVSARALKEVGAAKTLTERAAMTRKVRTTL